MRALVSRQRLVMSAAILASATLLAACSAKNNTTDPDAGATSPPPGSNAVQYPPGTLLVSNGTNTVMIAGNPVVFPTTATDAAWSPDGSRIAFIDGDGNLCTARPDGSGRVVLTTAKSGVRRSSPTWYGSSIVFTQWADGTSQLRSVLSSGRHMNGRDDNEYDFWGGGDSAEKGNAAPSASVTVGDGKEIAFQHDGAHGPEVWVIDMNQREPWSAKVADGAAAEISPDGLKVAFVARNGQVDVLATTVKGAKPVQVSFDAVSPSHLAWTPDGSHITYQTTTDVRSVAVNVAANAKANPSTQISPTTGVPTFLRPPSDQISRINGSDPVATMIAASQSVWPTRSVAMFSEGPNGTPSYLALVGTDNLLSTLGGLRTLGQPLLLTAGDSLDERTRAEMVRVLGKPGPYGSVPTVTLYGGISDNVAKAVTKLGYTTERADGADGRPPQDIELVFVANGKDAAAIASGLTATMQGGGSLQLTDGATLPNQLHTYLNQIRPNSKVIALDAAAQAALNTWRDKPASVAVSAWVGARSATPAQLLDAYDGAAQTLVVVDGSSISDVVTALGLARWGAALVVVDSRSTLDPGVVAWLDASSASINQTYIVDSSGRIGADLERQLGGLLSGPTGYTSNQNPKL